jgi:hypothetical protein
MRLLGCHALWGTNFVTVPKSSFLAVPAGPIIFLDITKTPTLTAQESQMWESHLRGRSFGELALDFFGEMIRAGELTESAARKRAWDAIEKARLLVIKGLLPKPKDEVWCSCGERIKIELSSAAECAIASGCLRNASTSDPRTWMIDKAKSDAMRKHNEECPLAKVKALQTSAEIERICDCGERFAAEDANEVFRKLEEHQRDCPVFQLQSLESLLDELRQKTAEALRPESAPRGYPFA